MAKIQNPKTFAESGYGYCGAQDIGHTVPVHPSLGILNSQTYSQN